MNAELVQRAFAAALAVLDASDHDVDGAVLLVELDGTGVSVVFELDEPGRLPAILDEGARKTRAAMQ